MYVPHSIVTATRRRGCKCWNSNSKRYNCVATASSLSLFHHPSSQTFSLSFISHLHTPSALPYFQKLELIRLSTRAQLSNAIQQISGEYKVPLGIVYLMRTEGSQLRSYPTSLPALHHHRYTMSRCYLERLGNRNQN